MPIVTRAIYGASLFLMIAGSLCAQPQGITPQADNFELRRVMLSTGGVGYFEYETTVAGDAELSFRVRRDQVDDVLKSVVVYDDEGRIGTISLPGQEPLRETFRALPFEPGHLDSPAALFNALRGAEVRVSGAREIVGRLLSVTRETVALPEGGSTTRHRVSLVGGSGIQQVVLEEAGAISFTDPALAADVETALAAVARHDDSDSRTLTVTMDGGTEERTVRVAYVIEVPLWKATYRLTLSNEPDAETAALQGWAVLENLTGDDWRGVELAIVSGNPVTFRQALYDAYYVNRPEVPVEVLGRVLPQVDEGGIGFGALAGNAPAAALAAEQQQRAGEVVVSGTRIRRDDFTSPNATATLTAENMRGLNMNVAAMMAAESTRASTQVLFRVPQPVTIAAGESVMVPIVSRDVPATRVSLYQPATHPRHPLASVLLTNDSDSGLPPGVLTLYERDSASGRVSHVGDARLSPLPVGDERLVSFAVDQEIVVDREDRSAQRLASGRIVDGMLDLRHTDRQSSRYLISAAPTATRTVIVEHPRLSGWSLVAPDDGHVLTESAYRLAVDVAGGESVSLDAVLERPRSERIELAPLALDRLMFWASNDSLSPALRSALGEVAALRQQANDRERELAAAQRERASLVEDQRRIRDNLGAVPDDSDLSRRYLDELTQQEDRLAALAAEIDTLQEAADAAQRELSEHLRTLSL